ncbi:MAG TPA: SpoIID/LytB domain-containing protein [Patescibacteria group bacterium]
MPKLLLSLVIPFLIVLLILPSITSADELADLAKKIEDLSNQRQLSEQATKPLESQLKNLETQLNGIQSQLNNIGNQLKQKRNELTQLEAEIARQEENLAFEEEILGKTVRSYYIKSRQYVPILIILGGGNVADITRELAYQEAVSQQDRDIIITISSQIRDLSNKKEQAQKIKQDLEKQQGQLAGLQTKVDKEAEFYRMEVDNAKKFQADLSSQIAELTAKQQAILGEKSGTFQTTVGDVPLADDPNSRPDFNPGFSPAFAAFSFGAPHFKGMSQYGAFGRAKSGQSAEQILKAYYGDGIEIKKDYSIGAQIVVEGYGSYSLEDYAKRIYEVPNSWGGEGGMEALKAQAVAARSYALARMQSSGSICATESCQVFKSEPKGGNWEQAVNSTSGWVLTANGQPFSSWYASTSGGYQESYNYNGYSTPGFWDTPSGRSGWTSQAYEKVAGSPWFYKGWYKSRSGDSCARSHPWLTGEEMADILNGWEVLFNGVGDSSRVTPLGPCWGDDPYNMSELRSVGGFTSVSGVSVTYSDGGTTASVTFSTNKGSVTINGNDFYRAFNLRSPGRIALKSGLFNIEKK